MIPFSMQNYLFLLAEYCELFSDCLLFELCGNCVAILQVRCKRAYHIKRKMNLSPLMLVMEL